MLQRSINNSVNDWLHNSEHGDADVSMFDIAHDEPETAWCIILKILEHKLTPNQLSLLAAGPLETLLVYHGLSFIDRLEREAKENQKFNYLLGGLWENRIEEEVWKRVQGVRKEVW